VIRTSANRFVYSGVLMEEMSRRIISQRHFSDCSLLVTTVATPEQAYAIVRRHFPNRAEPKPMRFRVDLGPFGLFVLNGRIVESVGGSNVYVCVAVRLLYLIATAFLLLSWLWPDEGAPWIVAVVALTAAVATVKRTAGRIARSLAEELPATARR
jgi:hypothetical protein